MERKRMIGFVVTASDYMRIRAAAQRSYVTVASFCRQVVMLHVAEAEQHLRVGNKRNRGSDRAFAGRPPADGAA